MARIFNWFDSWKSERLDCPKCGWQGQIDMGSTNEFDELLDFCCPKCDTMLAIINYPTQDEVRENQDKLSAAEKASYAAQMEHDAEFSKNHLESPSQLPVIEADPLILVWDIEFDSGGETAGPSYTTIKHEGQVIWRELAYYECVDRFNEVVKILRQKYGDSLKALIPTGRSETYLYGDIISPSRKGLDISTSFPILGIEALAESGDQGALNRLRYEREFAAHHLEQADQLPEVSGDFLVLSWDLAESPPRVSVRVGQNAFHYDWDKDGGDGFLYVTLRHEEQELWREAATTEATYGEDGQLRFALADRYDELAAVAKSKYGDRLKDVVPSLRSAAYYNGRLAEEALEKNRRHHFPEQGDDVLNLWRKAVAGYIDAQNDVSNLLFLGNDMLRDSTRAAYWCRQAADQGDSYAQCGLGILYENGDGVPLDDAEALTWYRKAADQGEPYSQFTLGIRYRSGAGVPQDYSEALCWLRKAAEQGQVDAQSTLGSMYESGQGVPQDYVQAYMWFDKAAGNAPESLSEGCREARKNLTAVAAKMTKTQRAKARRLVRESKPTLHLLPGSKVNDFQVLTDLFKTVTGRDPTVQELEETRATLDTDEEKDDK